MAPLVEDAQLARMRTMLSASPETLSLQRTEEIARDCGCSEKMVEITALQEQIVPERYKRNLGTIGWQGQIKLLQSTVAVVGAGGLGGWVIETLARMGVGRLVLIDGDCFEENNLNRQLGCTRDTLGQAKVRVMAERVQCINASVETVTHEVWLGDENADELLQDSQVVVDALDTIPARFILQAATGRLGVPLVHGAIAGWSGQVMTILPGDLGLRALYGEPTHAPTRGIETDWGNPSATPMMVAAWQAHEVIKLLLGRGQILKGRLLVFDAEYGTVSEIGVN